MRPHKISWYSRGFFYCVAMYMWSEQATTERSPSVISIVACCHSAMLCALAPRAFRSSQYWKSKKPNQKFVAKPLLKRFSQFGRRKTMFPTLDGTNPGVLAVNFLYVRFGWLHGSTHIFNIASQSFFRKWIALLKAHDILKRRISVVAMSMIFNGLSATWHAEKPFKSCNYVTEDILNQRFTIKLLTKAQKCLLMKRYTIWWNPKSVISQATIVNAKFRRSTDDKTVIDFLSVKRSWNHCCCLAHNGIFNFLTHLN